METKVMAQLIDVLEEVLKIFPVVLYIVRDIIARRKHPTPLPVITPIEEKVMTNKQAAKFLNVNILTLDVLTNSGLLMHRRIGSEKRYLFSDLLAYLEKTAKSN